MLHDLRPLLLVTLLGVGACGGHYVTRGADLFEDGRYVEAAEVFERTQHRLTSSPPDEQARYGLYRGATLFVLGDFAHAESWLSYASEVLRSHPSALDQDERKYLERVRLAVDARYRGLPKNTETAVAASQPAPTPNPGEPSVVPPAPTTEQPVQQRSLVGP
jgi:hypothetical protein